MESGEGFFEIAEGGFEVEAVDDQVAMGAVGLRVHAGDELVAPKDGEGEVAEFALGGGDVNFGDVVEMEEPLEALALDGEVVEGRQNARGGRLDGGGKFQAGGEGVGGGALDVEGGDFLGFEETSQGGADARRVGGVAEVVELGEAGDAKGAQGAADVEVGSFSRGGEFSVGAGREDVVRKVEDFLHAVSAADHEVSAHPELAQGAALDLAHAFVGPAGGLAFGFDIAKAEGAVGADEAEHAAHGGAELGGVFAPLELGAVVAHEGKRVAVVAGGEVGGGVVPVFEGGGFRLQGVEVLGPVVGHARPEDVMVGALDDVDGVDLDVTEVLEGGEGAGRAEAEGGGSFSQTLSAERKRTGLGEG